MYSVRFFSPSRLHVSSCDVVLNWLGLACVHLTLGCIVWKGDCAGFEPRLVCVILGPSHPGPGVCWAPTERENTSAAAWFSLTSLHRSLALSPFPIPPLPSPLRCCVDTMKSAPWLCVRGVFTRVVEQKVSGTRLEHLTLPSYPGTLNKRSDSTSSQRGENVRTFHRRTV